MIPQYGLVTWQDAVAYKGKAPKHPKKHLIKKVAVGMLALAADGTLVIIHEFDLDAKGIQRTIEGSVIPAGWSYSVIPLIPADETPKKVEGVDVA